MNEKDIEKYKTTTVFETPKRNYYTDHYNTGLPENFEEKCKKEYYASYLELLEYLKKIGCQKGLKGTKSFNFFISTAIYRPFYFENLFMLREHFWKKKFKIRNKIIMLYGCEEMLLNGIKKYFAEGKWRKICISYKLLYQLWFQYILKEDYLEKTDLKIFEFHNQFRHEFYEKIKKNITEFNLTLSLPRKVLN